jgi:hypothetical protein
MHRGAPATAPADCRGQRAQIACTRARNPTEPESPMDTGKTTICGHRPPATPRCAQMQASMSSRALQPSTGTGHPPSPRNQATRSLVVRCGGEPPPIRVRRPPLTEPSPRSAGLEATAAAFTAREQRASEPPAAHDHQPRRPIAPHLGPPPVQQRARDRAGNDRAGRVASVRGVLYFPGFFF